MEKILNTERVRTELYFSTKRITNIDLLCNCAMLEAQICGITVFLITKVEIFFCAIIHFVIHQDCYMSLKNFAKGMNKNSIKHFSDLLSRFKGVQLERLIRATHAREDLLGHIGHCRRRAYACARLQWLLRSALPSAPWVALWGNEGRVREGGWWGFRWSRGYIERCVWWRRGYSGWVISERSRRFRSCHSWKSNQFIAWKSNWCFNDFFGLHENILSLFSVFSCCAFSISLSFRNLKQLRMYVSCSITYISMKIEQYRL